MRVFGLIGYPLEYTLSPQIHNYVFRRLNIDADLRATQGNLKEATPLY